jgi:hypothetical protein
MFFLQGTTKGTKKFLISIQDSIRENKACGTNSLLYFNSFQQRRREAEGIQEAFQKKHFSKILSIAFVVLQLAHETILSLNYSICLAKIG